MSGSDIDEVLSRDTEGKLNWLVGEVTEIKQDVSVIKNNHLAHIESDMNLIKKVLSLEVFFHKLIHFLLSL